MPGRPGGALGSLRSPRPIIFREIIGRRALWRAGTRACRRRPPVRWPLRSRAVKGDAVGVTARALAASSPIPGRVFIEARS